MKASLCLLIVISCAVCVVRLVITTPLVKCAGTDVQGFVSSKLLKHDRLRLIEALAQDKPTVTILLAARPGMNEALVAEVRKLNGVVQYRDDDVDYVRVELAAKRVQELALSPVIEALNLAGNTDYFSAAEEEAQSRAAVAPTGIPPPDHDTPAVNPYLPAAAIGAAQFIASHPTFDGRGVVVAIVDSNIDFLLPELRTARALDGTPVPKFADIYSAAPNAAVQIDGDSNPSGYLRVAMETKVTVSGKKLIYQNHSYSAPRDGEYRLGMLDERIAGPSGDLNRDGNPAGSSELFTVLWNETTNTVWVDTNQNYDFADEKPMTDYDVNHDIGTFGSDDPKTPVRETVGFVVQTDLRHQAVFVIPGYGAHGTGVTGAAFGANFFGGNINGVAPAAQLISVTPGRGSHVTPCYIEAVITAMKDRRVDVVSIEFGNFLPLNDGHSTFSIVANRLVNKYEKLLFAAAGNGTDDLNGIASPADATEVIAVGSYLSRQTSRVNYGVDLREADNMNGYTSHGPTKEGGLKPDLLAPTTTLSTKVGFLPGENRYGTYSLPTGYQIYGGTSTSSPFAAAGAALLISAARQSGVKYDAKRLRWAMLTSARRLPQYSAEMQGAGLLQIEAAWQALKSVAEPIDIVSRAPVKAVLSEYLREPDRGSGIFEREGWTAGQAGQRTVTFTRTSGAAGPMNFQLCWQGNDGTFSARAEITLPLNAPAAVTISIAPKTNGVHSGILNLVSTNGAIVHQVMNTIVAADQLDSRNAFTIIRDGHAEWLHSRSYFINVPAGTPALRVDVAVREGNVMPSLTKPNGRFYYPLPPILSAFSFTRYQTGGTWSRVVSNPDPGVWQVTVDNCNTLETGVNHASASFQVTAMLLGVSISHQPAFYHPDGLNVAYTNTHAPFLGGIATSALGSAFVANATFKNSDPVSYEIDVVPGATRVGAMLNADQNGATDLDLYLFDCTGAQCVLRDFSNGNSSTEQVAVDAPGAGKWKVVVDPFRLDTTRSNYLFKDYFLHSAFGRLAAPDSQQRLANGAVASQHITLNVKAIPTGERYLEAFVFVTRALGPNSNRKTPDQPDFYYADKAILGTTTIPLKSMNITSAGK